MYTRRLRGFTLIELLVVIAIISVLAALLFPVFAQTREKARSVTCSSNCKQIATGLMLYAQDYDDNLPGWPDPRAHPLFPDYSWALIVPVMDPYLKNRQVWRCPDALPQFSGPFGPLNDRFSCSLGYSEYLYNTNHGKGANPPTPPYYTGGWNNLARLSSTEAGVSQIAVMADSQFPGVFNDWSNFDGQRFVGEAPEFGLDRLKYANGWDNSTFPYRPGAMRHTDYGCNVVFADCHAKFINGKKMQGGYGGDGSSQSADGGGFPEWPVVNPLNLPPR